MFEELRETEIFTKFPDSHRKRNVSGAVGSVGFSGSILRQITKYFTVLSEKVNEMTMEILKATRLVL